ncbi:MAG: queuosine precursor transporter [Promicromonosporaceae bacterium]|nr:queuosine precursor transporter [Promicromonosporaceae bacterium]
MTTGTIQVPAGVQLTKVDKGYFRGIPDALRDPISATQGVIVVLSAFALVLSNILVARLWEVTFFGFPIVLSGSIFIYPMIYVLSDCISEVYGYWWSRISAYLAVMLNLLLVLFAVITINMPVTPGLEETAANFAGVFGAAPRILAASTVAFFAGSLVDDQVFQRLRVRTYQRYGAGTNRGFIFRALLSSVCGSALDIALFWTIAFAGVLPASTMLTVGIVDLVSKFLYELILSPANRAFTARIKRTQLRQCNGELVLF